MSVQLQSVHLHLGSKHLKYQCSDNLRNITSGKSMSCFQLINQSYQMGNLLGNTMVTVVFQHESYNKGRIPLLSEMSVLLRNPTDCNCTEFFCFFHRQYLTLGK